MAFKFVCLCAMLAVAQGGLIGSPVAVATPVATPLIKAAIAPAVVTKTVVDSEYDPHPQYNYAYNIQDAITGDNKGHQEIRDGDVVQGRYFLVDSDGTRRTVEYTADPVNGFNAVVHREPLSATPVIAAAAPAPILAARVAARPVIAAAPLAYAAAPVAYATPIQKTIIH